MKSNVPPMSFFSLATQAKWNLPVDIGKWQLISSMESCARRVEKEATRERWLEGKMCSLLGEAKEIMLVLHGTSRCRVFGGEYLLEPGSVLLFDKGESRKALFPEGMGELEQLWLSFDSNDSFEFRQYEADGERVRFGRYEGDRAANLILSAWQQCNVNRSDEMCRAFLKAHLIGMILQIMATPNKPAPHSHHEQVVESVKEYVNRHLAENLCLTKLSEVAGYSPSFFHRIFLKHTGYSPLEYVSQARIERAKELLRQNYKIESVVESIGIASASYFYRFFKKRVCKPPRKWHSLEGVAG